LADARAELACAWMKYALRDLRAAKTLLQETLWAESTFHAQQAAEKALKAVLTALGTRPPRTHNIKRLVMELKSAGVDTGEIEDAEVYSLTQYAVEARYPDFEEEPSPEEAREALRLAERTVEWAQWRLREMGVECSRQPQG